MSMRVHKWSDLAPTERKALLQRPAVADDATIRTGTAAIIKEVRNGGDTALRALTHKFDGADHAFTTHLPNKGMICKFI